MRITWRKTRDGTCYIARITNKPLAMKGWAPPTLVKRLEADKYARGTWELRGPVMANFWTKVDEQEMCKAASKMIRAWCAACPAS